MDNQILRLASSSRIKVLERPAVNCYHETGYARGEGLECIGEPTEQFQQYDLGRGVVLDHDFAYGNKLRFFQDGDFMFRLSNHGDLGTWNLEWALLGDISKTDAIRSLIEVCGKLREREAEGRLRFASTPEVIVHYYMDRVDKELGIVKEADELDRIGFSTLEETQAIVERNRNYERFTAFVTTAGLKLPEVRGYEQAHHFVFKLGEHGVHWDPKTWKISFECGINFKPEEVLFPLIYSVYQQTARYKHFFPLTESGKPNLLG